MVSKHSHWAHVAKCSGAAATVGTGNDDVIVKVFFTVTVLQRCRNPAKQLCSCRRTIAAKTMVHFDTRCKYQKHSKVQGEFRGIPGLFLTGLGTTTGAFAGPAHLGRPAHHLVKGMPPAVGTTRRRRFYIMKCRKTVDGLRPN